MSNPTTKLVTQTRIRQLIECYGSSSASWPEEERQAALNLLQGLPELKSLRDQTRSLDNLLANYQALENHAIDERAMQSLQQRIMDQLPGQDLPVSNNASNNSRTNSSNYKPNDNSTHRPHRFSFWTGSR